MGIHFRDPKETYSDALGWLFGAGHLDASLAPRLSGKA
jgi:hypothetical protein